jgi:hypothetical protein
MGKQHDESINIYLAAKALFCFHTEHFIDNIFKAMEM